MSKLLRYVLFGIVIVAITNSASAQNSELERVPGDAALFIHLKIADIVRSETYAMVRQVLEKAGPKALERFNKQYVPAPASVDSLTVIGFPDSAKDKKFRIVVLVGTATPLDVKQLVQGNLEDARPEKVGESTIFTQWKVPQAVFFTRVGEQPKPVPGTSLAVLDARTFVFAEDKDSVKQFLTLPRKPLGAMKAAVEATATHPVVLAFTPTSFDKSDREAFQGPFQALLETQLALLTVKLDKGLRLDGELRFADEAKTAAGEKALRHALSLAAAKLAEGKAELEKQLLGAKPGPAPWSELPEAVGALFGLGMMNQYQELLAALPLQRRDNALHSSLEVADAGGLQAISMSVVLSVAAVTTLGRNANATFTNVAQPVPVPPKVEPKLKPVDRPKKP